MSFQPRPYQTEAINANVSFFNGNGNYNGITILPTGSGKSVVIANTASALEGDTIVFQPSKEILQQNYAKFTSYGYRAGIYSASVGYKHVDKITFATIGSVAKKCHLFRKCKNIIIDEAHLVNAEAGMYYNFIKSIPGAKVLGLTATPYRLTSGRDGAMLEFITRSTPRIFSKVLYYVQNDLLFDAGFLALLHYYNFNVIDRTQLQVNSNGSDFTDASLKAYYRKIGMPKITIDKGIKILKRHNNLLIFCVLLEDAYQVQRGIPGSVVITGMTEQEKRDKILKAFTSGNIRCVINVGVLTTGFDYPALEAVLIARSTMSLALYYQIVGRCMRPFTYQNGTKKEGHIYDLGGNVGFFGKIETMKIEKGERGYYITNNGKQLTDVGFAKA
jgi:DNA repair protein RadD